ncbi:MULTISPECIES: FliA/WhiG family RNA polymerase sigma factor [unclassified Sphingopyxis]|jgi:RNA polymerase sigma factor FliA|uniref:sigma-70 family RNA polymerase sigma factor n=1 Tax=unclassified Sphingopyxis TaxID=2614943 RepID=UPI0028586FB3|nr:MULTISPECIES: FliA/WhiG family RNA polymerase sigma factor [unclassified Sphingopyxis]MDR6833458.1 RNA polymerase sigma factor for flagellar operon FliA [Sphingopyxis sp. BE122]MDR7225727.1 RNA polymerase sigma factor for flagellar operon FliA [Sphingopyxis sp. BE259]
MRIELAEQFAAPTGRVPRARGYGESVEALVEEYAPLVRKIAWQVFSRVSRTSELDDLIQTGLIALIEASQNYEERGFAFATYATTRIRGAMIDQLRREADVGRSAMVAAKRIQATRAALEQQLRRAPAATEMAAALDLSAEDYFALERNATHGRSTSLDELTDIGAFLLPDDRVGADDQCEQDNLMGALRQCIACLSDREQMVLQLYFFEELNLHEIGLTLDVSAARICQIKREAMAKVDRMMRQMTD